MTHAPPSPRQRFAPGPQHLQQAGVGCGKVVVFHLGGRHPSKRRAADGRGSCCSPRQRKNFRWTVFSG